MALIDYIDGVNRDIYLHEDTVGASIHPIDIYKEYRTLRKDDETLRVWAPLMLAKGNDAKGSGKYTERYVVLLDGARIIPFDTDQTLTVVGTVITDDGQEGIACFDRLPLSGTTIVHINYVPPQVEVVTISTGDAATIATVQAGLTAQGYSSARAGKIDTIDTGVALMDKVVSNKREVKKGGGEWTLIIYDDDGTTPLRSKALKDFSGAEIADLANGVLAIEEASSV
jgi:hypothetical protein